jgi:hypothetical protein
MEMKTKKTVIADARLTHAAKLHSLCTYIPQLSGFFMIVKRKKKFFYADLSFKNIYIVFNRKQPRLRKKIATLTVKKIKGRNNGTMIPCFKTTRMRILISFLVTSRFCGMQSKKNMQQLLKNPKI